jgi:hypothetical protein
MADSLQKPTERPADEPRYTDVATRPPAPPAVGAPERPRVWRWIGSTLAVMAISIATVLLLEGGASIALLVHDYTTAVGPTQQVRPHTEHDTLLGWINRASFSAPHEYGRGVALNTTPERFRGHGPLAPLAPGHSRLVCSGDSFTMGSGVADDDTWCAQFHQLAPTVETVNMGQGAYGLDQAALWYIRDGVRFPHHVQVFALTYVQFERALFPTFGGRFRPNFTLESDRLELKNVPVPRQTMAALRRSYAATQLIEQLRMVQAVRRVSPRFDGTARQAAQVNERWALFEAIFDRLDSVHRANGTQFVMAYLPTKREARPGFLDERRRRLAEYAAKRGVVFFDLTPALRALPADSLDAAFITRIEDGVAQGVLGHYTAAGGTWAAREMAKAFATHPKLQRFVAAGPR